MKVLLFTGHGSGCGTPKMREIMKKYTGIRCRVGEIIEYVEKNSLIFFDLDNESIKIAKEKMKFNNETIVTFEINKGKYYYYNTDYNYQDSLSIVDVDATRPWTIEEYDCAEYIKYLDENNLVDEELNYWEACSYV